VQRAVYNENTKRPPDFYELEPGGLPEPLAVLPEVGLTVVVKNADVLKLLGWMEGTHAPLRSNID